MKLPKRFTDATMKLYNAFHKGELRASNCEACAVGNICNNDYAWNRNWKTYIDVKGKFFVENRSDIPVECILETGYTIQQLQKVESVFLSGFNFTENNPDENKESQFKGLCAVIEYLCELDNIPNIMDYTKLFETENDQPKYECAL